MKNGILIIDADAHVVEGALARACNDWLRECCSVNPNRLKGVALVPLHVEVKEAIREVERATTKISNLNIGGEFFYLLPVAPYWG